MPNLTPRRVMRSLTSLILGGILRPNANAHAFGEYTLWKYGQPQVQVQALLRAADVHVKSGKKPSSVCTLQLHGQTIFSPETRAGYHPRAHVCGLHCVL